MRLLLSKPDSLGDQFIAAGAVQTVVPTPRPGLSVEATSPPA